MNVQEIRGKSENVSGNFQEISGNSPGTRARKRDMHDRLRTEKKGKRAVFEVFGGHVYTVLEVFWGHFYTVLEVFWGHVYTVLEVFWGLL